jgi:F420-dependent oxidoreductase-like protein
MSLPISLWGGADAQTLDALTDRCRAAVDLGLPSVWIPQTTTFDAVTALAVVADRLPEVALGTAVVPIQGRHPIPLAQAALTTAAVAGPGRFSLGVGVTHAIMSEGWFGIPYRGITDLAAEELEALAGLLGPGRTASVEGERLVARATVAIDAPRPDLLVAALGPKMLDLAARHTDGTVTWMTGPVTLERDTVPTLLERCDAYGRPEPRVVAGLPVCVTDDVAGARARLAPALEGAAQLPSYRRAVEAEGIDEPVDLVLMGDEDRVLERLAAVEAAGATELLANVVGEPEERDRTLELLARAADEA